MMKTLAVTPFALAYVAAATFLASTAPGVLLPILFGCALSIGGVAALLALRAQ